MKLRFDFFFLFCFVFVVLISEQLWQNDGSGRLDDSNQSLLCFFVVVVFFFNKVALQIVKPMLHCENRKGTHELLLFRIVCVITSTECEKGSGSLFPIYVIITRKPRKGQRVNLSSAFSQFSLMRNEQHSTFFFSFSFGQITHNQMFSCVSKK